MFSTILRGLSVAFLSSIVISLMLVFFTPVLPFNILTGDLAIPFFFIIVIISFIVYLILPLETDFSSQDL
ncbi:MAG: hypothetical protein EAX86_07885 [Candidatus Heimdallarchaeota archaeon]|nr:hypothetical protein [Candidatus Heimdallarchaeota archaeon]